MLIKKIFNKNNFRLNTIVLNFRTAIISDNKSQFRKRGMKILTIDETINIIIKNKLSLARFGDGEISIMANDQGVGFQEKNEKLAERLLEVFRSTNPSLLIGLPDQFNFINNSVRKTRKFWMEFIEKHQKLLINNLDGNTVYGNTNITRFYMVFKNKEIAFSRFQHLRQIWQDQNILIVEGQYTRSGIDNDLYYNSKEIKRIICPAKNAFNLYDKIFKEIIHFGKNRLILLALGPTATVLAHDLSSKGFWVLDVGHLDVEYMWMLNKVQSKENIKGRHVNEASSNQSFEELDTYLLDKYKSQIISEILN